MKSRTNTRNKIFVILLILMVSLSYVVPVRYMVYATSEDTQKAPAEIQEDSSEELPIIEGKDISEEDLNIEESTTEEPSSAEDATEEISSVEEGSNEESSDVEETDEPKVELKSEDESEEDIKIPIKLRSAQSGAYLLTFEMIGDSAAGDNFYNLQITITDSLGNETTFDPDENGIPEGNTKWDAKRTRKTLTDPATIKISCQYKSGALGYDYEPLSFEAPFEEFVAGAYATGEFEIQNPGQDFRFCRYSIECEEDGSPVSYIDAQGGRHVQDTCTNLTTLSQISQSGWYAVRESLEVGTFDIMPGVNANLVICDDVRLKVTGGINIWEGASLTIWCQSGKTGTINTRGYYARSTGTFTDAEVIGPGIFVDETSSLTINGGIINARPGVPPDEADDLDKVGSFSSGIGGGSGEGGFHINCGEITINGGTIHAYGGTRAAGIGGGYDRSVGDVGDGGSHGKITITGGKVYAVAKSGGAGIGSARQADDPAGEIRITGGYVEARGGSYGGAGIGSGERSQNGIINILGGEVYAYSYNEENSSDAERAGTGIGAGAGTDQAGAITITNAKVYASGGRGAGIGGGGYGPDGTGNGGHAGGTITITNSSVVASSQIGAGIGGGGGQGGFDTGNGGNITINSGTILAVSYHKGAGIGGGNDGDSGIITINDGFVMAVGGNTSRDFFDAFVDAYNSEDYFQDPDPDASEAYDVGWLVGSIIVGLIDSNDWGGAGIGGGDDHDGETITINGGTVIATAGMNTAHAIGRGNNGDSDGNVSVYERSKTTYGDLTENGGVSETAVVYGGQAGANMATSHAYAKIEPGECTVTFDVNGIGTAPAAQHPNWGGFATRPEDPTAEGYLFDDWYKDPQRTQKFDFNTPINDNTTIYGKWITAYPLEIKKIWPSGQEITESVEVNYENTYAQNKTISGTLNLTPDNNWTDTIQVSDESRMTFSESTVSGYTNTGWKVSYGSESYNLPVDSETKEVIFDASTLNTEHEDFINALHNGDVVLSLTNSRIFSGYKSWEDCTPQEYTATNGGTEYHLQFRWEDVINHIDLVLQHYENGSWTTVERITVEDDLSATWDYKFNTPIDDPNNYRIREIISNAHSSGRSGQFVLPTSSSEKILYDTSDTESNGKEPVYQFKHTTNDGQEFTGTFTVEYKWENNNFIISNKNITSFSVEKKWDPDNDRTPKPNGINVVLQHYETIEGSSEKMWKTVETKTLNGDTSWKADFETMADANEDPQRVWRIRELSKDGTIAEDKAYFTVDEKDIVYNVSYEANSSGHTVITNRGHQYNVEKVWVNDGGERLSSVKVTLQHLDSRNGETERWTNVDTTDLRESSNNWHGTLTGWQEGEFRIRELNDMNAPLLDPKDKDGDGSTPRLVSRQHIYVGAIDYYTTLAFDVSYETDSEGNTVVTNTKSGPFGVHKNWDIDGANQFKPDSIEVVLIGWEAETGSAGWSIIEGPITLNEDNNWSGSFEFVPDTIDADWKYKVRELDKDGNIVIDTEDDRETDTDYYMPAGKERRETATYTYGNRTLEYEPEYEAETSTGRTIINNKLKDKSVSVQKKWTDKDGKTIDGWKPESIKVKLQHRNNGTWEDVEEKELNEENNWAASWLIDSGNISDYRVRELDKDDNLIYNNTDSDAPQDAIKNKSVYSVKDSDDDNVDVDYTVVYDSMDSSGKVVITNKLQKVELSIEKKWEIDLENKDRPSSIGVIVQSKKDSDDEWSTVKVIELNEDNNWKKTILVSEKDGNDKLEYKVRELREETALGEFFSNIKDKIDAGQEGYTEWIDELRNSEYFNYLPDNIKNAANSSYEDLLEQLNSTRDKLYDDLMELINVSYKPEDRIVADKKDSNDEDEDANSVIYHVAEYESALTGKTEGRHTTKYSVEYENDGNDWTITNTAILEIDNIKRWINLGVDDEDMPDSAWIVLMFKLNADAMSNAGGLGADVSSLSSIADLELPAFRNIPAIPDILADGGEDPISIISELALGTNINIFSNLDIMPKMAIANVEEDEDDSSKSWRENYTVNKYVKGIPLEYKGAELGSEIIRQIVKYLTGLDIPISYNPFDDYISIPTKAIKTIAGIEDPEDLIDFSALTGAAKKKAESLTMDDINNFGFDTLLDDWHLMANVINIKIDMSSDDDISGTKTWQDDTEENRPEWIKIHVKVNDEDIEGSPVELRKEDYESLNEWEWSIDGEIDDEAEYVVSEEFPEDYEYKDNYILETQNFDLINKWHENVPGRITISGQKIWKDDTSETRPEKITVRLMEGNKEVAHAETSKEAGWRYVFTDLPEKNEQNEPIVYTIKEDTVSGYEMSGGTKEDNYNITNTYKTEEPSITPTGVDIFKGFVLISIIGITLALYYINKKQRSSS